MPGTTRAEFDRLLQPILGVAYGTAVKLTGNRDDAQDLVQEASVLAFRAFHQFEGGTNFKAWFFRILINRFYKDHAKNSRRAPSVPIDEAEDLFLFQRLQSAGTSREGEDPLGTLFDQVDTGAVQSALEKLPEEFRSVAVLYFMNDFDYQQIADVLEVPIGTVRSRLHRARRLLQRALWQIALDRGIVEEGVPLG